MIKSSDGFEKASVKKFFYKCFLCLLFFSASTFAVELSDDEKRAFIESLATPSSETRVFYRWQPEDIKEKLLEAGEMTEELYNYYMGRETGMEIFNSGRGFYVAEDMFSSSIFNETIMKVRVNRGYPFIDLDDARVQKQLQDKDISLQEVYLLNPRVAVRDRAHSTR